jgi:hypothetical protein
MKNATHRAAVLAAGCWIFAAPHTDAAVSWNDVVRRADATCVVSGVLGTFPVPAAAIPPINIALVQLKRCLADAGPGDVVWISAPSVNLEGTQDLEIPAGVTLAGSRDGLVEGALLYTDQLSSNPDAEAKYVFRLLNDGRVTGLRFRGPSGSTTQQHDVIAIRIDGHTTRAQVDRNEFYHWTRAGILLNEAGHAELQSVRITRNYFHHNEAAGNGYGINVKFGAYPLIDRNTFDYNRHAISCDGRAASGYVADRNFVLSGGHTYCYGAACWFWDQHFDMHGYPDDGDVGGWSATITNNTFRGEQTYGIWPFTKTRAAFKLRGTPAFTVQFTGNALAHDSAGDAIHDGDSARPVAESGNTYDVDTSNEIGVGDFDGDGLADVFQATGASWYFSSGGKTEWRFLARSPYRLPGMALADFNGDGKTDVFQAYGATWRVSYGGTTDWQTLATGQPYPAADLRVGDFDGDGRADVFRADGTRWWIWKGNTRSWTAGAVSGKRVGDVRIADLNCDGASDVLGEVDGKPNISSRGTGAWTRINDDLHTDLDALVFGDFDGNGCMDIARSVMIFPPPPGSGAPPPSPVHNWQWSRNGQGPWTSLRAAAPGPLAAHRVGDFTGDGRADALHYGTARKFFLSSGASAGFVAHSRNPMR